MSGFPPASLRPLAEARYRLEAEQLGSALAAGTIHQADNVHQMGKARG
jgi:hypothetical protein